MTRACKTCGQTFEFPPFRNGQAQYCSNACYREARRTGRHTPPIKTHKTCKTCGETKPAEAFNLYGAKRRKCQPCYMKERAEKEAPRRKEYDRQRDKTPKRRVQKTEIMERRRARKLNSAVVEKVDRAAVIARDNSTCYLWCKRQLRPEEIELDHVVPLTRGGTHTADNLRVACRSCNAKKWTKLLSELEGLTTKGAATAAPPA